VSEEVTLSSPAKVNFFFRVVRRLESGYHEIASVMCKVNLCDEIAISLGGEEIEIHSDDPSVPTGSENTVYRAAHALLARSGRRCGMKIVIQKRIPVQSGLGGASSNAATVLVALNELLRLRLSKEELISLGLTVGSDVPFFIFGSPALVRGIGEKLSRIEGIPRAWIVIVKPPGSMPTGEAYKNSDLGLTEGVKNIMIPRFNDTLEDLAEGMVNDFEPSVGKVLPEVLEIKTRILQHGALGALLSGSGSSVFGVFRDRIQAQEACRGLRSNERWAVYLARTIFD
jgi:4-diphosphocytidyl-2-C-methyl-D-erythritol kinase